MITTLERAQELAEKWNALTDDMDRLQFLKDHNTEMMAVLDYDCTMVDFIFDDNIDYESRECIFNINLNEFHDYHYFSTGCLKLFEFAGIKATSR